MALRPVKIDQTTNIDGRIEAGKSPGIRLDDVAASRMKPPLTLEQAIAEKNIGTMVPESQPFAAFTRGLLNSALAGTPEAAGSLSGANPQFDPNSPQFTNPAENFAGEMIGNLVPLGRIGKAATSLGGLVREGMRVGGIFGAGQGVSKVASEENPTLEGAVTSGLTEGAKGVALGGAIPFAAGAAIKFNTTKQGILDDLLNLTKGEEGKMRRSVTGGYVQAADKVAPFLKKGDGVPQFIEATEKALEKEANTFRPIVEKAPPTSVNPDEIYKLADAELAKLEPNAETRTQLLLNSGEFLSDLTKIAPDNILQYASKSNREIGRIYKNPSTPVTSGEIAAKEAIRDAYGNTIRKILEDAGQDPSVYSGYGAIREMASTIEKNYLNESYKLSSQKGRSIPQNIMAGLESKGGGLNIARGIEAAGVRITEGEKGRLDKQISGLVDNFIGFGKESTNLGKAQKLESALRALNTLNKNSADPMTTAEFIAEKAAGR